ncbi:MAG TPA: hypothetical protein VHN80_14050 [Kineosporiaceae bacterium]|nr:hypothetical protein [Kineosporiaceae bacterium]
MTSSGVGEAQSGLRLGLRENAAQFTLLVAVNALVGGMLGQERTVLPLLADRVFHVPAYTAGLVYFAAFGRPRRRPTTSLEPCPTGTTANRSWSRGGWSGCRCRCC